MSETLPILREQLADIDYLLTHLSDLTPLKLEKMRDELKTKIERVERGNSE